LRDRPQPGHPQVEQRRLSREPDARPDAHADRPRGHWSEQHVQRENKIAELRRLRAPALSPDQWRTAYYARRGGVDRSRTPAPFDEDKAREVPNLAGHDRPRGLLDTTRADVPVATRYDRDALHRLRDEHAGRAVAELGFLPRIASHPEANAALHIRLTDQDHSRVHRRHARPQTREASLYLNVEPCEGADGCRQQLSRMLPEGFKLTVYAPNGFLRVYRGRPDPPDRRRSDER